MALEIPFVDPDRKRQAEWRERNVEDIKKSRMGRLDQLGKDREAIRRATEAYGALDRGDIPWIVLRNQFIRLDAPREVAQPDEQQELSTDEQARERVRELATRPPLTRLVNRQSNALPLYLTAIYLAHLETAPGHAFINRRHNIVNNADGSKAWNVLSGLWTSAKPPTRRARVRRALDELVQAGLVGIKPPEAHYRYEGWTLLKEDGSESPYRRPSEREQDAIGLPASFFLRGWHLVLTPGEIAMLLAITNMHQRRGGSIVPDGQRYWIALPQSVRRNRYGLSGEIYLHAQQLHEFGLIDFTDPMPNRRRGKISTKRRIPRLVTLTAEGEELPAEQGPPQPVPYRFSPAVSTVFNEPAFNVVYDTLKELTLPYRLDDNGELIGPPQELVKSYRQARQNERQR